MKLNVLILPFPFLGALVSDPLFVAQAFTLYSPSRLILTLHLLIRQVPTRVPIPSAASPYFLLVAVIEITLFRSLFPSIWLGRLLAHSMWRWRLFLEPLPLRTPILLAFSSGGALEAAFNDMSFFPFKSWDAEDRVILSCISRLFGLSLLVLGNYSPRHGP